MDESKVILVGKYFAMSKHEATFNNKVFKKFMTLLTLIKYEKTNSVLFKNCPYYRFVKR